MLLAGTKNNKCRKILKVLKNSWLDADLNLFGSRLCEDFSLDVF